MIDLAGRCEKAIATYLQNETGLAGMPVYEAGDDEMAIDSHPCIIVACLSSPRTGDTPIQMYAKTPSIVVSLYVDATEQTRADYQGYAAVLENCLENLAAIQAHINPQTTVTGLHVHYIEDYQTDSSVDENVYQFGVAFGLVLDLVETLVTP